LIDTRGLREEIEEIPGLLDIYNEGIYLYWFDNHGGRHVRRWLIDHDYDISTIVTTEYLRYLARYFREWLSETK
jgi:hypothetical protein